MFQKKAWLGIDVASIEAAVIKGKRPIIPTTKKEVPFSEQRYVKVMQDCWAPTAEKRPSFEGVLEMVRTL